MEKNKIMQSQDGGKRFYTVKYLIYKMLQKGKKDKRKR